LGFSAGAKARHVALTAAPEVSTSLQQQQRQQQEALEEARQSVASRIASSDLITQPFKLPRELKGESWTLRALHVHWVLAQAVSP